MPFIRISLREGKSATYRQAVSAAIHQSIVDTIDVPEKDRFQVITEHKAENVIYDPGYMNVERSDDIIYIQITMKNGRSIEKKKALYARIAELLAKNPGVRPQDVFITLIEIPVENWSFGNGEAQLAP